MKELTIEEKAKRYDEALERAKKLYNDGNSPVATTVEEIFPELKVSEDERIRKELIEFVKSCGGFKQEYIAWLEKQGEQKLQIEKLPFEMKTIGESLGFTTQEECDKYNQMVSDLIMCGDDKGKKKLAWSEEDENTLKDIEELIMDYWPEKTQDVILGWVKSIKQRIGG